MPRKQIPDIFCATVESGTLELVAGRQLDDTSWAAWFARYQAAFRQRVLGDNGQVKPFSRCRIDLRATAWADPSPLLSIALAIAEFVADGNIVTILLPSVPSTAKATPEPQASFLKFLAKEGFLDLLSLRAVEDLSSLRLPPSSLVEITVGADPLTPEMLDRLRLLPAALAFERATCLPARLIRVDVMENDDLGQLDRLDRWVERKLYNTIGPVVSDMVPSWAQAGVRYRLLMFLRETLHNIAEHAYIHRAASERPTTGYAALYVRYREGASGEAPANWNRLEKAVNRETYSWRVPLMKPSTLRLPFPNARSGFFEVFVMDAGQGLCRSLGDCPCDHGSDPVHKCMREVVVDGRGRREPARPAMVGCI